LTVVLGTKWIYLFIPLMFARWLHYIGLWWLN